MPDTPTAIEQQEGALSMKLESCTNLTQGWTVVEDNSSKPITHIDILAKGETCPPGYIKISETKSGTHADLNKSAGGDYLYLCYKRGDGPPITAVTVVCCSLGEAPPPDFQLLSRNYFGRVANLSTASDQVLIYYYRCT